MTAERFALLFPIGFGDLSTESRPRRHPPETEACSEVAGASWPCTLARWIGPLLCREARLESTPYPR